MKHTSRVRVSQVCKEAAGHVVLACGEMVDYILYKISLNEAGTCWC